MVYINKSIKNKIRLINGDMIRDISIVPGKCQT